MPIHHRNTSNAEPHRNKNYWWTVIGVVAAIVACILLPWLIKCIRPECHVPETEVIAISLAVVAIIYAGLQNKDARETLHSLQRVGDALSTQFLAKFPNFTPDIIDLLENAKSEVIIVSDVVAYGFYSDYARWPDYVHAIDSLGSPERKVKVRFIFLDAKTRAQLHRQQFRKKEEWTKDSDKIASFIDRARHILGEDPTAPVPVSTDDSFYLFFLDYVEKLNEFAANHYFPAAIKIPISHPISVYMWVADGNKAIFSIPSFSANASSMGFYTSDRGLIDALVSNCELLIKISDEEAAKQKSKGANPGALAPAVPAPVAPTPVAAALPQIDSTKTNAKT